MIAEKGDMMRKHKFVPILTLLVVLSLFSFAPANSQRAVAAPAVGNHLVYNLFATDGFTYLADGTMLYIYGFVGGYEKMPLYYLTSADGVNQSIAKPLGAAPGNPALPPPAPVGGGLAGLESELWGSAQIPAPVIWGSTQDTFELRLKNLGVKLGSAPNDPHSIHLHGLDVDAANDGVPETSVGAVPAAGPGAPYPGGGNVVVYMFTQPHPGTYFYHCHQEADIHVQMGMYGALVVYNPTDEAYVSRFNSGNPISIANYTGGGDMYGWRYDRETILLESEWDTRQHKSEQLSLGGSLAFNPVNYKPQYWMLNGISFPTTIGFDNPGPGAGGLGFTHADWLLTHPGYDPFATGSISTVHGPHTPADPYYGTTYTPTNGDKTMLRMINMGFETQPMHMHGYHAKVIGSDQRGWNWANQAGVTPEGYGLEKNTLTIGSGEAYEWLIDFGATPGVMGVNGTPSLYGVYPSQQAGAPQALFPGGTQSRQDAAGNPTSNTVLTDAPISWTGVAYLPGPQIHGADVAPAVPYQLFPFHNHDDYKATNNGAYPGGMFTMIMPLP